MKRLAIIVLLLGGLGISSGCATPAYTARERNQMISRNRSLEWRMATDDVDHVFMLRPVSRLTIWSVR